jgi:hypothetical protein
MKLLLLLLLLPVASLAEHHRGHILDFLGSAEWNNAQAKSSLQQFGEKSVCNLDSQQAFRLDVAVLYSDLLADNLAEIERLLLQPVVDLDQVRRMNDQPVKNETTTTSSVKRIHGIMFIIHSLMGACQKGDVYLRQAMNFNMEAWRSADLMNWHIQDAIREEVYGDAAFICSGPDNHCE